MERPDSPVRLFENRRILRELPELTRQLGILLRSGERLDGALATVAELSQTRRLQSAFLAVRDDVRAGEPLAGALARHPDLFSEFYRGVVALGEAAGDLAGAVRRVADHLLRQQHFSRALATAVSYPLLLLGVAGLSFVVLLVYVLPEFRGLFEDTGVELPWLTEAMLSFSESLRRYGWIAAGIAAAAIVAGRSHLQQPRSRYHWHRFLLRIPLVSDLIRRIDIARFSDSLGAALAGGVPLLDGLRLSQSSVGNLYLRRSLDSVVETVRNGGRLGEGLRQDSAFPALGIRMIQVGEQSGRLDESLRQVAEVYDDEFDSSVRRLLNILEPVLIMLIGSGIALVILAMISAIQSLNTFSI
jgi:general secretion pathway protein F